MRAKRKGLLFIAAIVLPWAAIFGGLYLVM